MSELIDAKGLACPEPVVLAKKALNLHDEVTVIVDNETARENVNRLAASSGCAVDMTEEPGGIFRIHIKKQQNRQAGGDAPSVCRRPEDTPTSAHGPTVFVISSNVMGHGNDDLGAVLMKAFIHTAVDLDYGPDIMIFYNTGVKFTASDSDVIDDLLALQEKGVKLLICGACANFFNLTNKIGAGSISNMYDIAGALSTAGRIIKP
ncbi:MAG: sulfurtransferase-like selenium metabolism protein YedF [Proteobacteria bacterium]|nr:sulfurtransferase-like selenium metabolism protein YedF [Pseudomonadota bacterium]